ncbi:unnamed protein product, partial [Ectocarpus sp. 12 AP-2014]
MAARGGRGGWAGDKTKRYMMVGTKDALPAGGKTGVVAPVPINTPSLRQEIQGDNGGTAAINRSGSGGGWGSAVVSSASANSAAGQSIASGKGKGRRDGSGRQRGDDVFTRHFPDLRAGLEQAEKLDAVTKASSKVAPLRKPKSEPAKDQGPSLRPRAMLKPTGSAGGGSTATAAAQAAIADAVHNRVATAPKPEERRRPMASFADEISSKSRWAERPLQEGGSRGRGAGRGTGGTWEMNKERGRDSGQSGHGFERAERGRRDAFPEKEDRRSFRQNSNRSAMNSTRGRESIFGSGAHVGVASSTQDSTSKGSSTTPSTTYVRQHGPPPRKVATPATTPAPAAQQEQPLVSQQPTRSSAYSASKPSSDQSHGDPWGKSAETPSKWRSASPSIPQPAMDAPPEAPPMPDSPSSQSGSYVRAHGPPRRSGWEGQADERGETSVSSSCPDHDAGGEPTSRFGGSWGTPEQGQNAMDKDSSAGIERTQSGRWREPAGSLAPPPHPTNTRWKEPKEEPRAGARRWKAREDGQMGGGRWGRSAEEDADIDDSSAAPPTMASSPSLNSSWKESADDGWGLEVPKHARGDSDMSATASTSEKLEQQEQPLEGGGGSVEVGVGADVSSEKPAEGLDAKVSSVTPAEGIPSENATSFGGSFAQQQQAHPVIPKSSWEPQLPRGAGGDLWETPGNGRDHHTQQQRPGQAGASTSGGSSRPWSDPWGTSGFGLSASGDQRPGSIASFLDNAPEEPRKDRYLPPALRNRNPSHENEEEAANIPLAAEEIDTNRSSLPDVASADVSAQDLVMSGGGSMRTDSPDGSSAMKAPLYEQQQQQQQQQVPLEEWQQGGAQASRRSQQNQTAHAMEPQLQQQQPVHQSHQPASQPLHLHEHANLDRGYQRNPSEGFSSFQPQKHQMQDPGLHQFQAEHFQAQAYQNQQPASRGPLPEQHLPRHQYQSDHLPVQRQHYNQVQV